MEGKKYIFAGDGKFFLFESDQELRDLKWRILKTLVYGGNYAIINNFDRKQLLKEHAIIRCYESSIYESMKKTDKELNCEEEILFADYEGDHIEISEQKQKVSELYKELREKIIDGIEMEKKNKEIEEKEKLLKSMNVISEEKTEYVTVTAKNGTTYLAKKPPVGAQKRFCEKCQTDISLSRWSTHIKTKKHVTGISKVQSIPAINEYDEICKEIMSFVFEVRKNGKMSKDEIQNLDYLTGKLKIINSKSG